MMIVTPAQRAWAEFIWDLGISYGLRTKVSDPTLSFCPEAVMPKLRKIASAHKAQEHEYHQRRPPRRTRKAG